MKNNKLVKFSLTLVCSAVLAACGSSGGSDDSAAQQQQQQQQQLQKQQAEKAAAEKAAAEKAAAEKEAAAQEALVSKTTDVGAKFVKKTASNLNVGEGTEISSKSSKSITNMTVELHPSLDTVVVAVPLNADGSVNTTAPQAYLEDFDFRGNTSNTTGEHTLQHIYKTTDGSTLAGAARTDGETSTKTETKGSDTGLAYVYEDGRLNYTRKEAGRNVVDTKVARTDENLAKSVAEVYGHRTFLTGDSEVVNNAQDDTVLANAPFTAKDAEGRYTAGSKLSYVQYGRVTSKLHAVEPSHLKDGKNIAQYGTKVASYGQYGEQGTEDNYFYRGVNNTPYSATLAADLKNVYFGSEAAGGTLNYRGHAVTYNLDRDYQIVDGLPNALGADYKLVSGTHVNANIDLATKAVTGNLYNVWQEENSQQTTKYHNVELAKFSGTLANNGSISGTATKFDNTAGVLQAGLFGGRAEELGGTLASTDTTNNWGAAFGAKVQNTTYVAPKPQVTPNVPAWGESTDQRNVNNPNTTSK